MKLLTFFIAILGLNSSAFAETEMNEVVDCTIQKMDGSFSSFLPPKLGDQLRLDTSQSSVTRLDFSNNNMIPVLVPLEKKSRPDIAPNMIHFQARQYENEFQTGSLNLVVRKIILFTQTKYSVEIQEVIEDKLSGLLYLSNAQLKCEPVP